MNPTDTNQASEDGLREQLADKLEWYSRYRERGQDDDMDRAFDGILAFIRTEKLKLLDRLDSAVRDVQNLTAAEKANQLAGLRIKTDVLAAIYNERNELEAEL